MQQQQQPRAAHSLGREADWHKASVLTATSPDERRLASGALVRRSPQPQVKSLVARERQERESAVHQPRRRHERRIKVGTTVRGSLKLETGGTNKGAMARKEMVSKKSMGPIFLHGEREARLSCGEEKEIWALDPVGLSGRPRVSCPRRLLSRRQLPPTRLGRFQSRSLCRSWVLPCQRQSGRRSRHRRRRHRRPLRDQKAGRWKRQWRC